MMKVRRRHWERYRLFKLIIDFGQPNTDSLLKKCFKKMPLRAPYLGLALAKRVSPTT